MTRAYFYVESDRAAASTFVFHARHHKVFQSVPTTCARQQSHSATFLPASFSLNRQTRFFLTSTGKTLGTRRINPTIVFRMGERRDSAKCRGKRENPYRFQTHFFARSGMDLTLGKSLARRKALDDARPARSACSNRSKMGRTAAKAHGKYRTLGETRATSTTYFCKKPIRQEASAKQRHSCDRAAFRAAFCGKQLLIFH